MQHRISVLKANAFEAAVFLTVAVASLAAALAAMTLAMPFSHAGALLIGLATCYWASIGLFRLADQASAKVRARLHRAAHCTDCTPAAVRD